MHKFQSVRPASIRILPVLALALSAAILPAQTVKVQGSIKARNGAIMIVQTAESPKLEVVLTDSTQVSQVQGVLKARRKEMAMTALIPGLAIQAEGVYNQMGQLVAASIKFKGDDLQQAQAIQAGLSETHAQAQKNKEELEKQNAELQAQNERIAANKAAVEAAAARFGQLDDYYILDEVTVLFGNGKVNVEPRFHAPLEQLAAKAKTVNGYMIQVKGYASASGSESLNQKLSEDRANNVVKILLQRGRIPLTNMLAPGAMGESRQVEGGGAAESEAQNRRVVVRVLQNKGVAGI